MISLAPQQFITLMEECGYPLLREEHCKPYHLNIVGIRNRFGRVNHFDDIISIYYEQEGRWVQEDFEATTLPGIPSLLKPANPRGAAILKPGQYRYRAGLHKHLYEALVQDGPVTVYRDNNKNLVYDLDHRTEQSGMYGINIHKASFGAKLVGPESAGCQVIREGFDRFIKLVNLSLRYRENNFIYTLIEL